MTQRDKEEREKEFCNFRTRGPERLSDGLSVTKRFEHRNRQTNMQ